MLRLILSCLLIVPMIHSQEQNSAEPKMESSAETASLSARQESIEPRQLTNNEIFPRDFNFHNKNKFLIEKVEWFIKCIEGKEDDGTAKPRLPEAESLLKSNESEPDGKDRFVFKYNGSRNYKESCLGDPIVKDFLFRLYDAHCINYTEKISFLESFTCNASQHLECRQVGNEPERKFAEQATPIMRCLCPDYNRTQAYLDDLRQGYYDEKRKLCVMKAGQNCRATPKILDRRWSWRDIDYPDLEGRAIEPEYSEGIDVVDLRPFPYIQACVNHAFCYVNDSKGLVVDDIYKGRCVCEGDYLPGDDGECHPIALREVTKHERVSTFVAVVLFMVGFVAFVGVTSF